jgi:acyl carrier protein
MDEIGERIKAILAKHLEIPASKIIDSANLLELGADSLDAMELAIVFEDEFGCEIPDEDAETLLTVADIKEYIEKHAKK